MKTQHKQVNTTSPSGHPVKMVVVMQDGEPIGGTHAMGSPLVKRKPVANLGGGPGGRLAKGQTRLAKRLARWEEGEKRNPKHRQHKPGSNKK